MLMVTTTVVYKTLLGVIHNVTLQVLRMLRTQYPVTELPIYGLLFVMSFLAAPAAVPNIIVFLLFRPVCQTVLSLF